MIETTLWTQRPLLQVFYKELNDGHCQMPSVYLKGPYKYTSLNLSDFLYDLKGTL